MTADRIEPPEATAAFDCQNPEGISWELPDDRYRVVGEIGRGGMGVVLRVVDASFDRPLAIKVTSLPCRSWLALPIVNGTVPSV